LFIFSPFGFVYARLANRIATPRKSRRLLS
jgi:hypothetical protein